MSMKSCVPKSCFMPSGKNMMGEVTPMLLVLNTGAANEKTEHHRMTTTINNYGIQRGKNVNNCNKSHNKTVRAMRAGEIQ